MNGHVKEKQPLGTSLAVLFHFSVPSLVRVLRSRMPLRAAPAKKKKEKRKTASESQSLLEQISLPPNSFERFSLALSIWKKWTPSFMEFSTLQFMQFFHISVIIYPMTIHQGIFFVFLSWFLSFLCFLLYSVSFSSFLQGICIILFLEMWILNHVCYSFKCKSVLFLSVHDVYIT